MQPIAALNKLIYQSVIILIFKNNLKMHFFLSVIYQFHKIFQMLYGRKPCDIEIHKDQYEAHIKMLQVLKSKRSPFHRSLTKERKQVKDLMKNSHKLHRGTTKFELQKRLVQTQRKNYDNIPSILKRQLSRKILSIPIKHKPSSYLRDIANIQIANKILHVKSQFNFKQFRLENISKSKDSNIRSNLNEDYSEIYQQSSINKRKKKRICVKTQKSNKNISLILNFKCSQMVNFMKDNNLYALLIKNGQNDKKSAFFTLSEFLQSEIVVQIGANDTTIILLQNIGQKEVNRFKISFDKNQLNYENSQNRLLSKNIEDMNNRIKGLVQISVKHKKVKKIGKKYRLNILQNQYEPKRQSLTFDLKVQQ